MNDTIANRLRFAQRYRLVVGAFLFVFVVLFLSLSAMLLANKASESLPLLAMFEVPGGTDKLTLSRNGSKLGIIRNVSGPFEVWDTVSGQLKLTLEQGRIRHSLAFSPNGEVIATGGVSDHERGPAEGLILWDAATGNRSRVLEMEHAYAVAFSPDGNLVSFAGGIRAEVSHHRVHVYNCAQGQFAWSIPREDSVYGNFRFSPDGKILAAFFYNLGKDGRDGIRLFEVSTGRLLRFIEFDSARFRGSPVFSEDGNGIAAIFAEKHGVRFRWWNVEDGKKVFSTLLEYQIFEGAWLGWFPILSHDGTTLASWCPGSTERHRVTGFRHIDALFTEETPGRATLLNARTGKTLARLASHSARYLALSEDGSTLATMDNDDTVRIWEMPN